MLMFRSPKERTPDYYDPQITSEGQYIGVKPWPLKKGRGLRLRVRSSLGKQERFQDYKYLANITSNKLGPGVYRDSENFKFLRQKPCPTVIKKAVLAEDSTDPCYMYIGNHLVFEPEFTRSFKMSAQKRSASAYSGHPSKRPCTKLCSTLYKQDEESNLMRRTQTAKIRIKKRNKR